MTIFDTHTALEAIYKEAAIFRPEYTKSRALCRWTAILRAGEFKGVYDYRAGILSVSIHLDGNMVSIGTIDDGVWQALSKEPFTPDIVEKLKALFASFEGFLPSESDLNQKLQLLGLYGVYTG